MSSFQRGRKAIVSHPEVSDIRVLSRADLSVLAEARPTAGVKTLRDSHHRLARAVAAGLSNQECADLCGISYNRVSILRQDPAFAELVAHYRGLITAEYVREADPITEYLRSNALKAQRMIGEALDEADESGSRIPMRSLLSIAELGLDRTGYGKVNKNVNVNVDFAAQLEAARKRSANARPQQIEAVSHAEPQSSPTDAPHSAHRDRSVASFRRM